jgi:hypothetical protein
MPQAVTLDSPIEASVPAFRGAASCSEVEAFLRKSLPNSSAGQSTQPLARSARAVTFTSGTETANPVQLQGNTLYSLSQNFLHFTRLLPDGFFKALGKMPLGKVIPNALVADGKGLVAVFSSLLPDDETSAQPEFPKLWNASIPRFRIQILDAKDPGHVKIKGEFEFQGTPSATRLHGSNLRFIVTSPLNALPEAPSVTSHTADALLPKVLMHSAEGKKSVLALQAQNCSNVLIPQAAHTLAATSLLDLDLNQLELSGKILLTQSEMVHSASEKSVYLLHSERTEPENQLLQTFFHKISVSAKSGWHPQTSGQVPGQSSQGNPFENAESRLRIATFIANDSGNTNKIPLLQMGNLDLQGLSPFALPLEKNKFVLLGTTELVRENARKASAMQLRMFDFRSVKNPKLLSTHTFEPHFTSDARWDHQALAWDLASSTLAFPVVTNHRNSPTTPDLQSQVFIFQINEKKGIKSLGSLLMSDLKPRTQESAELWLENAFAQRTVFKNGMVYAISQYGIRSARIQSPHRLQATHVFP